MKVSPENLGYIVIASLLIVAFLWTFATIGDKYLGYYGGLLGIGSAFLLIGVALILIF